MEVAMEKRGKMLLTFFTSVCGKHGNAGILSAGGVLWRQGKGEQSGCSNGYGRSKHQYKDIIIIIIRSYPPFSEQEEKEMQSEGGGILDFKH